MRSLSPLRSGAFRFALTAAGVFAVGTAALLFTADRAVTRYAGEVARDGIAAEAAVLRDEDQGSDRARTVLSVVRHENAVREHQLRYLLVDAAGRHLAGSLPASVAHVGWRDVVLPNADAGGDDGARTMSLTALGTRLKDGAVLVVAGDTADLTELRRRLGLSTAAFGGAITLLALIGGYVVGTVFLRRLERVNRSVERIMAGAFAERLPSIGMSPEFDHLSNNLNRMLGRIEALMEGMRQVSTDIAHDLRTPLTRLRQRLEAMKDGAPGAVAESQVDAALAQTDEILAVFRTLLRISALEAGAGRRRIAQVDLSALTTRLFEAYGPVAEDAAHALVADIPSDVVGRADPEMLTQAVTNLLENALIHTPAGSTISLGLERRPDGVAVVVADNGPGIPAGNRQDVLKRFYRLDGSRGTPGAGLGLALVSAVAAIHGAALRLTDNAPGLRAELFLPDAEAA